jgi:sugar/nucleoside kinase (ribokinase family)
MNKHGVLLKNNGSENMEKIKILDVIVPGYLFCDVIFTGLGSMPQLGEETFADSCHISVGGVAHTARVMKSLKIRAAIIADLGNDIFSAHIKDFLAKEKLNTSLITYHERPMPTITVALSFTSDRAYVTNMKEIDSLGHFSEDPLYDCDARHLHIPGLKEGLRSLKLIDKAKEKGMTISLDCQWHPDIMQSSNVWNLLEQADVFLPNEREALFLSKKESISEALEFLRKKVPFCVIKRGRDGAIGSKGSEVVHVSAMPVKPIDTTGAGDSFNGGFLFAYLNGFGLYESIAYGNICGGIAVTQPGAEASFCTKEIKNCLNKMLSARDAV